MRYKTTRRDDASLRERMKAIARERRRFGYRRLHMLLHAKASRPTTCGFFRLYREERPTVRRRGGRKRAMGTRALIMEPDVRQRPLVAQTPWRVCRCRRR